MKLSSGDNDAGIAFRATDSNNLYLLKIAYNCMQVYKVVGGTYTALSSVSMTIPAESYYNYKVVLNGNSIKAYKDGVLQLDITDSTYTSGKVGTRVAGTTVAYFDDVVVSN